MDNFEISPKDLQNENSTTKKRTHTHSFTHFSLILLVIILTSSVFGAFFGFLAAGFGQKVFSELSGKFPTFFSAKENSKTINTLISREKIVEEDSAVIEVVEKSAPSVVSIVVSKDVQKVQRFFDPFGFFDNFSQENDSTDNAQKTQVGAGTGFLITAEGMIVTNKHVVSDTVADYTVITSDDKEHPARVLARDPLNDIAIIKIEGTDYPTLSFGNSDELKIGQTVIAIGNSLGEFSNTVSKGIISGLRRNLTAGKGQGDSEKLTNIIQTDAAINPGNSGGPLLDISGKVIGINVAIAQGAQNVGFAIPEAQVQKITEQVKTTGKISTPYLGVRYIPVDETLQRQVKLPFEYGVMILRGEALTDFAVMPGSPADKAGLMENDVILEVNGEKINAERGLVELLAKFSVGDEINLKVWHKGEIKELKVKLEERNQ